MTSPIYRYKITNTELNNEIVLFAQYNKYEKKDILNENFEKWCQLENIKKLIEEEENMLLRYGYDLKRNPIYIKIFKSIKYYHIKKMNICKNSNLNIKTNKQKIICFNTNFIDLVKEFISEYTQQKPSESYVLFCKKYKNEINEQQNFLKIHETLFYTSLKKMYKNQYYLICKKYKS